MKSKSLLILLIILAAGCDANLEPPVDDEIRQINYEVTGEAEQVIIEFIDADGKVKGTGVQAIPWSREFDMMVGDKLYLSAWSSETGGGFVEIRVLVDGKVFRTAQNGGDARPRISGNAF